MREDFERAIRQRDAEAIMGLMFEPNSLVVKSSYRTETDIWDYKQDCPLAGKDYALMWAEIAKDVLAFHNNRGGVLVFGIDDKTFLFHGATTRLDSKLINDQLRRYLGDRIWVEYHRELIQADQKYIGLAIVPSRGPAIERFKSDAPELNGKKLFSVRDSAIREGDSSRLLKVQEADEFSKKLAIPTLGRIYYVDELYNRILNPDYIHFVERSEPCAEIERALKNPRATVTSLIGIGGAGKTALATWAVLRAYDRKDFDFIVSVTAKDRELSAAGIRSLQPALTSFESLLDNILEVLGFPEEKAHKLEQKEKQVRSLLEGSNGLLYVDNLETVDDARIISFLDNLPVGVRAIVTSRRTVVRVSVHPIDLGPLTDEEGVHFIRILSKIPGFTYVSEFSRAEASRMAQACDGIPLAIRWALARSKSASEALLTAEGITATGRRGEELLEFCFRRVFERMPGPEKAVLHVLSLFQRPMPTEVILKGANLPHFRLMDATDDLLADALVQRLFDPDRNDYCYTLLPIARAFVYSEVRSQPQLEEQIRKTLGDWFEAKDIIDVDERKIMREARQGKGSSETALLDLAQGAERRGDDNSAKELYDQALQRNHRSWRAARLFGEFQRHKLRNVGEALRLYEQAAANSPSRGPDRALIYREWGMLLKDSGDPQATDLAIDRFETALKETPNDVLTIHALANMLDRRGAYRKVVELLEPLANHYSHKTRQKTLPILLNAYERLGEVIKAASLKSKISELSQESWTPERL